MTPGQRKQRCAVWNEWSTPTLHHAQHATYMLLLRPVFDGDAALAEAAGSSACVVARCCVLQLTLLRVVTSAIAGGQSAAGSAGW
jgi:hypothetical protein